MRERGEVTWEQLRLWVAGFAAASALIGAAYRWVAAPISGMKDDIASVKTNIAIVQSDLAAHYALDRVEQKDIDGRVARLENAVDLANHDPKHDQEGE